MAATTPHAKKRETYDQVFEQAYTLPSLIHPNDVDEEADSWDEIDDLTLDDEIGECINVASSEGHYNGAIKDLAITLWADSLPRVKLDDLVFDEMEEAVREGYWPYKLSRLQVEEILWEIDEPIPSSAWNEAREIATAALADKLDPRREEGDSL